MIACLLWCIAANLLLARSVGFRLPGRASHAGPSVPKLATDSTPAFLQPVDPPTFPFSQAAWQGEPAIGGLPEVFVPAAPPLAPAEPQNVPPPEPLPVPPPVIPPPAAPPTEVLPLDHPQHRQKIQLSLHEDRLTLTAREAPLNAILGMIAQQHGLNIITGANVTEEVTVTLNDVRLTDALDSILGVNGYTWTMQRNILMVTPIDGTRKTAAQVQGRVLRVLPLNYVAADDVDKVVKGLLSPVGQSFVRQTAPTDQRRTQEQIVVEDLPHHVQRIAEYVCAVDHQPRQVLVEAYVLQVQLKDDCKHGVNFEQLLRIANTDITLETTGFANPMATPGTFFRLEGTDLNTVIEALKSTTDSKTLASPKVAVLNGQEARIQVGGQIGYLTTTTTETSAVQTVNFLNTGVILLVTPIITDDGQVLMTVKPQVSSGRINPTTSLPETETTEVETRVMLADGEAVVIGGLIKETDNEVQNKIPYLGDVHYVGRLFQRRTINRERSEVIIALLPRIMCAAPGNQHCDTSETARARTPLFTGALQRVDRSAWEPLLPDATNAPRSPALSVPEYSPATQRQAPSNETFQLPPPGFPIGNDLLPPGTAAPPPTIPSLPSLPPQASVPAPQRSSRKPSQLRYSR